jgi:hypothetical protein
MSHRGLILLAAWALGACASGPHPALQIASKDLNCEQSGLQLHEIYPQKVRVEGCGKQAIYVDACSGYGMDEKCGWGRQYTNAFERDVAEREKADRAEAGEHKAEEEKAAHEKPQQEEAERAVEQKKVEQEEAERAAPKREEAEQEKAERENAEKADGEHASVEADEAKPERKSGKRPKPAKKDEGIDSFLK